MQKKQYVPMYGSKCNLPNSVILFTNHYLKNYGCKSTIVTKVPLSVDLVELHILNQCRNYTEVHAYKKDRNRSVCNNIGNGSILMVK